MQSQVTSRLKPKRQLLLSSLPSASAASGRQTRTRKRKSPADTREAKWRRDLKREVRLHKGNWRITKKEATLISHHLWRFVIVCPWPLSGCFYSAEREGNQTAVVVVVVFLSLTFWSTIRCSLGFLSWTGGTYPIASLKLNYTVKRLRFVKENVSLLTQHWAQVNTRSMSCSVECLYKILIG